MTDILAALTKSKASQSNTDLGIATDYDRQERVIIDGLLSISDEVFECELHRLGVDHETISWRLKEPVESRDAVILMYERGIK